MIQAFGWLVRLGIRRRVRVEVGERRFKRANAWAEGITVEGDGVAQEARHSLAFVSRYCEWQPASSGAKRMKRRQWRSPLR